MVYQKNRVSLFKHSILISTGKVPNVSTNLWNNFWTCVREETWTLLLWEEYGCVCVCVCFPGGMAYSHFFSQLLCGSLSCTPNKG